jgi:hypothetical protein
VLDINRLRAGKMAIQYGPTDMWTVVRDVVHAFQ